MCPGAGLGRVGASVSQEKLQRRILERSWRPGGGRALHFAGVFLLVLFLKLAEPTPLLRREQEAAFVFSLVTICFKIPTG